MKFRYIVVFLETGEEPTGTDSLELAQAIADQEEQAWVIDTEQGLLVESDGERIDVEQQEEETYLDSPDDEDSDD